MRLSFACSKQTLEKAVERMRAVLPQAAPVQVKTA
jgi:bifunctional pyridoxal-dependent enzyme with beta-cystathionase and maltose regulon repressor activities